MTPASSSVELGRQGLGRIQGKFRSMFKQKKCAARTCTSSRLDSLPITSQRSWIRGATPAAYALNQAGGAHAILPRIQFPGNSACRGRCRLHAIDDELRLVAVSRVASRYAIDKRIFVYRLGTPHKSNLQALAFSSIVDRNAHEDPVAQCGVYELEIGVTKASSCSAGAGTRTAAATTLWCKRLVLSS